MGKLKLLALPLAAVLLLMGCSDFFSFNLFKDLDPVTPPDVSTYEGAEGLDQLAEDLTSPAIVDALTDDPEAIEAIEDMLLEDYLNDGVSGPEDQQAAILYAELNLVTSSGDDLVNNIVDTVLEGVSEGETVTDFLKEIVPPEVQGNPAAFDAMIKGLLDANDAYVLLGNSIVDQDQPPDGKIDAGEGVPPGVNMGDVAQKAIVAYMVATISTSLGLTKETAGTQLYYLLYDPTNPELTIGDPSAPDPFALQPPHILNIFAAAGLPFEPQL